MDVLFGSKNLADISKDKEQKALESKTKYGESVARFNKATQAYYSPRANKAYYDTIFSFLDKENKNKELQNMKTYLVNLLNSIPEKVPDNETGIYTFISSDTDEKLKTKFKTITETNKEMTPEVTNVLNQMFENLSKTYKMYRFFEYKYVQTNVILLDYIKRSSEIFEEYADYSTKFAASLVIQNMRNMKTILETVTELDKDVNNRLSSEAVSAMQNLVTEQQKESSAKYDKLLNQYTDMKDELQKSITKFASEIGAQEGSIKPQ